MSQTITLRGKGQLTLPSEIREKLNLDQGARLIVDVIDNQIVISRPEDVIKRTAGIFASYATDGPVEIDRDTIWGEIAEERDTRITRQIAEDDGNYDPD